jgi:hypothetical protein
MSRETPCVIPRPKDVVAPRERRLGVRRLLQRSGLRKVVKRKVEESEARPTQPAPRGNSIRASPTCRRGTVRWIRRRRNPLLDHWRSCQSRSRTRGRAGCGNHHALATEGRSVDTGVGGTRCWTTRGPASHGHGQGGVQVARTILLTRPTDGPNDPTRLRPPTVGLILMACARGARRPRRRPALDGRGDGLHAEANNRPYDRQRAPGRSRRVRVRLRSRPPAASGVLPGYAKDPDGSAVSSPY